MSRCKSFATFGTLVIAAGQLLAQSTGRFVRTGNMTTARLWQSATLLLDGKVLLAGGFSGDRSHMLASAEVYDPDTGTFAPTGSMKLARAGHAATRLADGRVLITGGYAGTEAEIYDPSMGTFVTAGNMTAVRSFHGATLLNTGKVLITGGHPLDGSAAYVASAEVFDPESGIFSPAADMTAPRYNQRTTMLADGSVLIVPGSDGADYTTSEVYDSRSGSFRSVPFTNSHGLVAATSNLLPNGEVLLTLDVAECDISTRFASFYDPATSTFSSAPSMNSNHCEQASTPLANGAVLIVGSLYDSVGPHPMAELYDIQSDRFSAVGEVLFGRFSPRATLLNNGKVLITGGEEANAELYEPAASVQALRLLEVPGGHPAILHADSHLLVSADNPARAGEALEIYCTGLIEGSTIPPQVAIGGRFADVLYFGSAPGFSGLNQVNARVPSKTERGSIEARLTYLGRSSNPVSISVQ